MYKLFFLFWVGDGLKIQEEGGAGLACFGNFCSATICSCIPAPLMEPGLWMGVPMTGHRHVLRKLAKGASPATTCF